MHGTRWLSAAALLLLATGAAAQSAGFTPDAVDLAAAKREGVVSWYTSTPIVAAQKVANLFQAETGIKVELFRSGGSAVLRRFLQEIDAKRVLADVLTVSDPAEVNGLAKRDLLVPFRPKNFDKIPDAVKDPKGQHIAQRVNLAAIIMRTDKGLEAPEELAGPDRSEVQGRAGHAGSLVHGDPAHGGGHAVPQVRVGVLPEAARQRRHDRPGPSAGLGGADPG